MFEFSIALSEQKADSAKKLYKEIKSTASSFGAVVTSYSENGKIFIVVACDDIEKPRISFFICDAIADIITTDFKLDYINKNLNKVIEKNLVIQLEYVWEHPKKGNITIRCIVSKAEDDENYVRVQGLFIPSGEKVEYFR